MPALRPCNAWAARAWSASTRRRASRAPSERRASLERVRHRAADQAGRDEARARRRRRRGAEVPPGGPRVALRAKALCSRSKRVLVRLSVVATDLTGRSTLRSAPAVKLVSDRKSAAASAARMPAAIHPEPGDVDGDEVRDEFDNCPTVRNGSQVNTTTGTTACPGEGEGDACDADDDNDGVPDAARQLPRRPQSVTGGQSTGNGHGDACPPVDADGDGLVDDDDNCDSVANPDQADLDGDDKGDACDADRRRRPLRRWLRQLPDHLQPRAHRRERRRVRQRPARPRQRRHRHGMRPGRAGDRRPARSAAGAGPARRDRPAAGPGRGAHSPHGGDPRRPRRATALLGGMRRHRASSPSGGARRAASASARPASWPVARRGSEARARRTPSCASGPPPAARSGAPAGAACARRSPRSPWTPQRTARRGRRAIVLRP